jgi:hypothetical protein
LGGSTAGTEQDHFSDDVWRTHGLRRGIILAYALLLAFRSMSEMEYEIWLQLNLVWQFMAA